MEYFYNYLTASGLNIKRGPNKEEEVTKHKSEAVAHKKWKRNLDDLKNITFKLKDNYQKSKGEFALGMHHNGT